MSFKRNCLLAVLTRGIFTGAKVLVLNEVMSDYSRLLVDHPDPN
jgi:hypothetical protein